MRIGVDGGGSKTECILIDGGGEVVAHRVGPGCNPSIVGNDQARLIVTDVICATLSQARMNRAESPVASTLLCMAGNRGFWREFAATLHEFGAVQTTDDSLPVLELATGGAAGVVLHAGTGSFVAARGLDGSIHYGGGLGWRFGDAGSGYEIGRRAIAAALLEAQGWKKRSRLGPTVCAHAQLAPDSEAGALTRFFYQHPEPNRLIASLAPAVLRLASEGDSIAHQLVVESVGELVDIATGMATRLFAGKPLDAIPAGLSGPILTHPTVLEAIAAKTPLPIVPVEGTPIEGVRRMLMRMR